MTLSVGLRGGVGAGAGASAELPSSIDGWRRDRGEDEADGVPNFDVGGGAVPDAREMCGCSYWVRRMLGPADLLLPESGLGVLAAPRFVGVVPVEIERVCATVAPCSVNELRGCPSRPFPLFLPYCT